MINKKVTSGTWAEINLDAFEYNLNSIKNIIGNDIKICGIVKADAYGHGAVEMANFFEKNKKVDYLGISKVEEGIELRKHGITLPILNLGYTPESLYEEAIKNNICLTTYSLQFAKDLNKIAKKINKKAYIHIKLDTGMSRLGFLANKNSLEDITTISNLENVKIKGLFTHFARADEVDEKTLNEQLHIYNAFVLELNKRNIDVGIKHVSNSAGILKKDNSIFDMVRPGIIMYGCYPSEDVVVDFYKPKTTITLKSTISNVKTLPAGSGISYGHNYITSKEEKIVTIPVGYADGFLRGQKDPSITIKGKLYPIVGRICMDQCMAKVDINLDVNVGDEVILWGEGGLSIDEVAKKWNSINHEVMCALSRRIPRVYYRHGKIEKISNYLY